MLDLETALVSCHPQWLRGRRARLTRSVLRTLVRATRVEEIEAFVAARRQLTGFALVEATLDWLDCRYVIDQIDFFGFNVDAEFADAIDGLVLVDLARMLPHKRRRYLEPRPPRRAALRCPPEQVNA